MATYNNLKGKLDKVDKSKLGSENAKKAHAKLLEMVSNNKDNPEMLTKIEGSVDKFMGKVKSSYPEALEDKKPAPKKEEGKPSGGKKRGRPKGSTNKKRKSTPKKKSSSKGGKTVFELASEIRKEDESWRDAVKRAGKQLSEETEKAESKAQADFKKLLDSYKEKFGKASLKGTDVKRDANRKAKPAGKRVSKDGNVYYENRPNRTDRKVGDKDYVKGQYLAKGGKTAKRLSDWTNYIPSRDIESAQVELKGGRTIQLSGDDILDGVYEVKDGYKGVPPMGHSLAKGGKLKSKADYIPRYDIKQVTVKLKNGKSKVIPKGKFIDGIYFKKKKR